MVNYSLNAPSWRRISTGGLMALMLVITGCQSLQGNENTENVNEAPPVVAQTASDTSKVVTIAQAPIRVGEMAPDFTGVDSNGTSRSLSDFRGQVVVLEWTNHECPFVRKHYGSSNMQKLQQEATSKDVVWLSIISSANGKQGHVTPEKANELTQSRGANPTAVILDAEGTIGRLYNARTTPHMYVIGADGVLKYMGAIDDKSSTNPADVETANNYIQVALDALRNNRPVTTAVTQPYGCSVKYGS
ncbi:MAG: redoxin domain-containing protein [Xenococcaceae cyanobacterium]